jgi:hypothetical protein
LVILATRLQRLKVVNGQLHLTNLPEAVQAFATVQSPNLLLDRPTNLEPNLPVDGLQDASIVELEDRWIVRVLDDLGPFVHAGVKLGGFVLRSLQRSVVGKVHENLFPTTLPNDTSDLNEVTDVAHVRRAIA